MRKAIAVATVFKLTTSSIFSVAVNYVQGLLNPMHIGGTVNQTLTNTRTISLIGSTPCSFQVSDIPTVGCCNINKSLKQLTRMPQGVEHALHTNPKQTCS
jgi:hypothetical protein